MARSVRMRGVLPLVLVLTMSSMAAAVPLPLVFESNQGQTDPSVRFIARSQGSSLFLLDDGGALLSLPGAGDTRHSVRMSLQGGQALPTFQGIGEHGKASYYRGNDPKRWIAGIPTWDRAHYTAVYPGIDLVYYANDKRLEFDFVVAPGADPEKILLGFEGLKAGEGEKELAVDGEGRLRLATPAGDVTLDAPRVYQDVGGERRTVEGRYQLADAGKVRFALGAYDASRPLVIDPVLVYSSFFGGNGADTIGSMAVDSGGNLLFMGVSTSTNFPLAAAAVPTKPGGWDAFIAKVSANGSQLIFSTYIGSSGYEEGGNVAFDAAGNAYIAGVTTGADFPVLNALQPQLNGVADFYITKLNLAGALVYSTYLGGSGADAGGPLAVRPDGKVYAAGWTQSTDFPVVNPAQGSLYPNTCGEGTYPCSDMVLTVLSPSGTQILYSTYWGGAGDDHVSALAVDSAGDAYLAGPARADDFPLVNPFQPQYGGGYGDFAVLKIRPDGTPPFYSTLLGGVAGDWPVDLEVDAEHNAYVIGYTSSTDLPVPHAIQAVPGGLDWYVAKINSRGTGVEFATFLGGPEGNYPGSLTVDALGNLAITGRADAPTFHVLNPLPGTTGTFQEAVVAKIHATGPTLLYATHLGGTSVDFGNGITMDARGDVYVGGNTDSEDFPKVNALQPVYGGHGHRSDYAEGFFAKMRDGFATLATPSRIPARPGESVTVPVRFTPGGFNPSSTIFSIDFDESCLAFNPADANADGIPDSVVFNVPAGYSRTATYDAGDTDGEIDFSLFYFGSPAVPLPLGEWVRITFQVKPTCGGSAVSTLARVGFSTSPQVSFGGGVGSQKRILDGSVEVLSSLEADCNDDLVADAGDLDASILEIFDTDGDLWLDTRLSSFPGSPVGCDPNADDLVDAGDLSCTVLVIFEGPGACASESLSASLDAPVLELPAQITPGRANQALVPVSLRRGESRVNSVAFSLIVPDSFSFDPTDANHDGVPDAVMLQLPDGFTAKVRWSPKNRAGQLALFVYDASGRRRSLPDDSQLAVIRLTQKDAAAREIIRFGTSPNASFGLDDGKSARGTVRVREETK